MNSALFADFEPFCRNTDSNMAHYFWVWTQLSATVRDIIPVTAWQFWVMLWHSAMLNSTSSIAFSHCTICCLVQLLWG